MIHQLMHSSTTSIKYHFYYTLNHWLVVVRERDREVAILLVNKRITAETNGGNTYIGVELCRQSCHLLIGTFQLSAEFPDLNQQHENQYYSGFFQHQ